MAGSYDFAILGSSPLAALLAGLLAHDHGKRVLRIADPVSTRRLPRAIDVALPFATRPETWRLLRQAEAETAHLLAALDSKETIVRLPASIVADLPETATALAHMRHVTRGFGIDVRGELFDGVAMLAGPIGLDGSNVQTIGTDAVTLDTDEAGRGHLVIAGERAEIGTIVLADDAAVFAFLPDELRPSALAICHLTATQTAVAQRLAAPLMRWPDRGVSLHQHTDLSILALVVGENEVEERLASCLVGPFPLRRLATSRSRRLMSRDGAPLIGPIYESGIVLLAGLGDAGAFLAPPLARFLAGSGTPAESAWFAAHRLDADRAAVADIAPAGEMAP